MTPAAIAMVVRMSSLAGFKRVHDIPETTGGNHRGHSKYDELFDKVRSDGGVYAIDMDNRQHAASMATNLRHILKRRGYDDIIVSQRGIKVYVSREEDA